MMMSQCTVTPPLIMTITMTTMLTLQKPNPKPMQVSNVIGLQRQCGRVTRSTVQQKQMGKGNLEFDGLLMMMTMIMTITFIL